MKRSLLRAGYLLFWGLLMNGESLTAAWVRAPGESLVGLGVSYTSANKVYDGSGNTSGIPRFTEVATQVYGEHGVTDRLTLGAALPVLGLHSAEDSALLANQKSQTGIGDSVVAARYQLVQGPILISAGLDLGLPTGSKNATIPTGDGEFSFLPRVAAAGGFQIGLPVFYLVSAGYHKRTVGFSDEIHGQLMGGFRASFVTFIFSVEARQSLKNGDAAPISSNPLYLNNASFFSYAPGIVLHANERLTFNIFYKGGFLVRNILGAPSISAGASYVF